MKLCYIPNKYFSFQSTHDCKKTEVPEVFSRVPEKEIMYHHNYVFFHRTTVFINTKFYNNIFFIQYYHYLAIIYKFLKIKRDTNPLDFIPNHKILSPNIVVLFCSALKDFKVRQLKQIRNKLIRRILWSLNRVSILNLQCCQRQNSIPRDMRLILYPCVYRVTIEASNSPLLAAWGRVSYIRYYYYSIICFPTVCVCMLSVAFIELDINFAAIYEIAVLGELV